MDFLLNVKNLFMTIYYPRVLLHQTLFWGSALYVFKNPTLVDVSWASGHFLIGLSLYLNSGAKLVTPSTLVMGLVAIWFMRLGGFIFYNRIYKSNHVDPRYEKLRKNRNELTYYFFQFQFQGILLTLTSIPLIYAFKANHQLNFVNYIGFLMCIIGILGEAVADQQLQNYKDNNTTGIKDVFRGGLFKNSRHPNLFFELVFWFGISLTSIHNFSSLFSLVGPTLLFLIMKYLTIRITEKHMMDSRPNYKEVIKETNMFLPL